MTITAISRNTRAYLRLSDAHERIENCEILMQKGHHELLQSSLDMGYAESNRLLDRKDNIWPKVENRLFDVISSLTSLHSVSLSFAKEILNSAKSMRERAEVRFPLLHIRTLLTRICRSW